MATFLPVGAGVLLAASVTSHGMAGIVHVTYAGGLAIPQTSNGVYFNAETGQSSTTPSGAPGWDIQLYGSTDLFTLGNSDESVPAWAGQFLRLDSAPDSAGASALSTGFLVGTKPDGAEWIAGGRVNGFAAGTANYLGFRFIAAGGTTHYAWMRLSTPSGTTGPRSIMEYAFESTPDAAIAVGAIPAPSSLMVFVTSLLAGGRRRRSA